MLSDGSQKNLKGGTDISAGAEFKINKQFSAWLDFDNILNSKYERWNNYPVMDCRLLVAYYSFLRVAICQLIF